MEANHKRILRPGSEYDRYLPVHKLQKTDPILVNAGDVFDTILEMERIVKKTLADTASLAPVLRGRDLEATLCNVWEFVYRHVQYTMDEAGVEQLRRPLRTWADRQKGVDCDCYAIFISSVLSNLAIGHSLRMTKYEGKGYFQHIYVIVPKKPGSGSYYTLDCVVDRFDHEVPFTQKHDKKMMPIQYLNGLGSAIGALPGFGQEFRGFSGLGNPDGGRQEFLNRLKLHLVNTRKAVAENPRTVSNGREFAAQLDFLLANWEDGQARTAALNRLSAQELNGLGGFAGFFDTLKKAVTTVVAPVKQAANWAGDQVSTATSYVADKAGQATSWAGDKLQDVGEAIIKYNPVSVAIRNGLLLAFKINLFRMSERLGYGYWTEEQARAKGLNGEEWRKVKERLDRVVKIHQGLQGDLDSLRKNILEGWEHGTKKHGLLRGLGEPVTATAGTAAASGVIATVLAFLKDIDWAKLFNQANGVLNREYEKAGDVPDGYKYPESEEEFGQNQAYYSLPPKEAAPDNTMLYVGGGLAVVAGLFLLRKK